MPGLDDLSVEDLQAIQAKKWDSVSGPGLQAYQQYRQSKKQATAQAQNPPHIPDAADKSAQGNKPGAQSVSIQNQEQSRSDQARAKMQAWADNHKNDSMSQRLLGSMDEGNPMKGNTLLQGLTPAVGGPAASIAAYLGKSGALPGLVRVGANTATGAATGALNNPGDMKSGAEIGGLTGGLVSTGAELLGGALKTGSYLGKRVGGWLGKLSKEQQDAYVRNPELAKEIYGQSIGDKSQFEQDMFSRVKEGTDRLQDLYIDPRMNKLNTGGDATTYRVNPEDFVGTKAGKEMQRAWDTRGNTQEVVPQTQSQTQTVNLPTDPTGARGLYTGQQSLGRATMDVPVQEQISSQQVPAPMPSKGLSVTRGQLLSGKRASSDAADIINDGNPNTVSAPDRAQAEKEAAAAVSLSKALHGHPDSNAPGEDRWDLPNSATELDRQVSQAISYKNRALGLNNPARILNNSDAIGSTPMGAVQDYLDVHAGTNFKDLASAYDAGRAMNAPNKVQGLFGSAALPVGRAMVKSAAPLLSAAQSVPPEAAATADQALLQSLFSNQNSNQR